MYKLELTTDNVQAIEDCLKYTLENSDMSKEDKAYISDVWDEVIVQKNYQDRKDNYL